MKTIRSLGDLDFKEPARFVECDPDVTRLPLQPHRDSFVILGSDGLWDVLSDTDAVLTAAAALRVSTHATRPATPDMALRNLRTH
jgi:serine/threonine protein phosphatase PrpC